MSEFWGFYATRTDKLDVAAVTATLKKLKSKDAAVLHQAGWLYVISRARLEKLAPTVLQFDDHESSAWSFSVYVAGLRIGGGVFGENAETGAEDEGFDGELDAVAQALGTDAKKLERTFANPSNAFLKLLGLALPPIGSGDIKPGLGIDIWQPPKPKPKPKKKPTAASAKRKPR